MALYVNTMLKNYGSLNPTETAAFNGEKSAELFVKGIANLSSDDQTTLATQIAAAQMLYPQQPVAVQPMSQPDGHVRFVTPPGLPNYGKD